MVDTGTRHREMGQQGSLAAPGLAPDNDLAFRHRIEGGVYLLQKPFLPGKASEVKGSDQGYRIDDCIAERS
jgi:hypothetical protein